MLKLQDSLHLIHLFLLDLEPLIHNPPKDFYKIDDDNASSKLVSSPRHKVEFLKLCLVQVRDTLKTA
uniref:Uncharacterized protein n=1 Tax=Helianthus annuus TaxID=4232 RepID=A0A251TFE7_HELAN